MILGGCSIHLGELVPVKVSDTAAGMGELLVHDLRHEFQPTP